MEAFGNIFNYLSRNHALAKKTTENAAWQAE